MPSICVLYYCSVVSRVQRLRKAKNTRSTQRHDTVDKITPRDTESPIATSRHTCASGTKFPGNSRTDAFEWLNEVNMNILYSSFRFPPSNSIPDSIIL